MTKPCFGHLCERFVRCSSLSLCNVSIVFDNDIESYAYSFIPTKPLSFETKVSVFPYRSV